MPTAFAAAQIERIRTVCTASVTDEDLCQQPRPPAVVVDPS